MTIKHTTTKAAGQKLYAVADWNAIHLIEDIEMTSGKKIYFDTAKTLSIYYSADHDDLIWSDPYFAAIADLTIAANTGVDGGGNWEPDITFYTDGSVGVHNTSQGLLNSRTFNVEMSSGIKLTTIGTIAWIKADNVTGGTRTFQFPNVSGSFVTTGNTEDIMVAAPAAANSAGTAGQIAYDASFFYVCTAASTWKRVAISTWP